MYLSIRDDVVFAAGYGSIAEGLKDLGIPGVELFVKRDDTVSAVSPQGGKERLNLSDAADLNALKQQADQHGIVVSALCMGNNFNAADKDFEVAWAVRTVRAAQQLGAPAVRVDAIMSGEKELPLDERLRLVSTAVKRILAETEDTGVDLGIENHGYQGNDPVFVKATLDAVASPRLGLTLDSGNYYWRGWPLSRVYEIFEEFAPYVKHTHIKNINYPEDIRETQREMGYEYGKYVSPIHEGDIDHTRYFAALRKAGYNRDLCLEDESLGKYDILTRKANLRAAAEFFKRQIVEAG
jgi:sugar phosphate isomerase/epimerase